LANICSLLTWKDATKIVFNLVLAKQYAESLKATLKSEIKIKGSEQALADWQQHKQELSRIFPESFMKKIEFEWKKL